MAAPAATPLISVVLPTRNSALLLPAALQSLAGQTFRDFEVIVSDGASTDGTPQLALGFTPQLPRLQVDSRPDAGVYDAINRGVRLSRGTWFLVLGSDDTLHARDTLAAVAAHLQASGNAELVHGDVRMMAANLCGVAPGRRFAGAISADWLCNANVCQQSVFYRRSLYDALGGFNERYRLYADWDFNLRAAFRGPVLWMDVVVADYAATGMSATAVDPLFVQDLPELIRSTLLSRPHDRSLWPAHRRLREHFRLFRKRGRHRQAWTHLGAYLQLLAHRIPALLKGAVRE